MVRSTELVKGFRQSTPYVNSHRDKTMVISLSGEAISHENFPNIVSDIALLHSLGVKLVLVFGVRPQIEQSLQQHAIDANYHKQIRVTDSATLPLVMQAAGQSQLAITAHLSMSLNNTPMAGNELNIVSGNFVIAQPLGVEDGVDYQSSGRVRRIDVQGINRALDQGSIVLISPVAGSVTGECFNLVSEDLATKIAIKLGAAKLIGFSPEQGYVDDSGAVVSELIPQQVENILKQGKALNSNRRFLEAALLACRKGVQRSHLISYAEDGALIQELFSRDGIGTQIVTESAEQIRKATIDDIGGILDLIIPLESEGILVRRSREQLEQEIEKFTIIIKDDIIIGCVALYPYPEDDMAEMACLAIHSEYRDGNRGAHLLTHMKHQTQCLDIAQLFILTTHSLHWFREQGFSEIEIADLPIKKRDLYNFQRNSKILALDV
ncbi:amino-acid N-acetyltransferase [Vibrio gallicus]|uniref:amino-acid N-acetyltransferase n=1 Tax=Vibrio gallicus TaxID=190897 RepID=UPI0021C28963|nr:amino-acid N-acetyltransferase [Vibrio gallicus]